MLSVYENIKLQLEYMPELSDMYKSFRKTNDVKEVTVMPKNIRPVLCVDYSEVFEALGIDCDEPISSADGGLMILYHPSRSGERVMGDRQVYYTGSALCVNKLPFVLYDDNSVLSREDATAAAAVYLLREPAPLERSRLKKCPYVKRLSNANELAEYIFDSGKYDLNSFFAREKSASLKPVMVDYSTAGFLLNIGLENSLKSGNMQSRTAAMENAALKMFESLFFQYLKTQQSGSAEYRFVSNIIAVDVFFEYKKKLVAEIKSAAKKYAGMLETADAIDFQTICQTFAAEIEKRIKDESSKLQKSILNKWEEFL